MMVFQQLLRTLRYQDVEQLEGVLCLVDVLNAAERATRAIDALVDDRPEYARLFDGFPFRELRESTHAARNYLQREGTRCTSDDGGEPKSGGGQRG